MWKVADIYNLTILKTTSICRRKEIKKYLLKDLESNMKIKISWKRSELESHSS